MIIRGITTVILFLGIFIAPWWIVLVGVTLCMIAYRRYIEGLVVALGIDTLYGASMPLSEGFVTVVVVGMLMTSVLLERYIRSNVRL